MTEFNSKVSKNEYEIIFKTDTWSDYTAVQEAIRGIIDRNKSQRVSLYISGKRYNRHRLVGSIPLHEALEVAHRHYETNFNKEVIHNESKRTY